MLLAQFAAAAPEANIRPSVACLFELDGNPAAEPLRGAGVDPVDLKLRPPLTLRTLRAVRKHIAEVRPDVVHTHLGQADVVGGIAARSLGVPVVSTIHTTIWDPSRKTYVKRKLVQLCADRIVAVSDSAAQSYLERGFASRDQLTTIRNGIAVTPEAGSGRELRAQLGWNEDDLVVGMLSALRAVKGHDVAIATFRQLADAFPKLKLLIVGRGGESDRIASATQDLGGRVAMIGHRLDVMRCFDAFDVCLHPSRAEAFPTTLLEAMAASVPVLATAVGGIPEIISDGETGILVPAPPTADRVASALSELLRDPRRRRALGQAAQRSYERQFTIKPWILATRQVYEDVLAGDAGRIKPRVRRRMSAHG
ncbi:MAG TPA: glycosyltransferase family 4 protein [Solirubrobacteraceae bacterium]|nr:glycosyltransferase family 4 protein [Solirubrobacteraceae bacterium]